MGKTMNTAYAIKIKPLSVNQAWQGRRYKTPAYRDYEKTLLLLLPPAVTVPDGRLHLNVVVGYSNKQADIDNFLKPFVDILQKKYGFNDNRVYRLTVDKQITNKGAEFIGFDIKAIEAAR